MLPKFLGLGALVDDPGAEPATAEPPAEETVAGEPLGVFLLFFVGFAAEDFGGVFLFSWLDLEDMGRRRLDTSLVLAAGGFSCSSCALVLM